MRNIFLFAIIFIVSSCKKEVDINSLDYICGYWQISKAENTNGDKKEYPINEVYDFFELKNNKGIHKKVVWQPTGKFLVNNIEENIKISSVKEDLFLVFSNRYGSHTDKLDELSPEEMVLISNDNVKYFYKKVILEDDIYGQTNK